jgi:hypothetical protein
MIMEIDKKRRLSAASLLVACVSVGSMLLVTGCGSKPAEETTAAPAAPAAPPVNAPPGATAPRPAPNSDAAANAAAFAAAKAKAEGR